MKGFNYHKTLVTINYILVIVAILVPRTTNRSPKCFSPSDLVKRLTWPYPWSLLTGKEKIFASLNHIGSFLGSFQPFKKLGFSSIP